MELLEKESIDFYLERAWTVLRYAFFKEEEYDGLNSHQEAVLEFLNYSNRLRTARLWWSKEGLIVSKKIYAQKLYEFREEKINYTDIQFFDKMKEYPIYVNKEMMKAKESRLNHSGLRMVSIGLLFLMRLKERQERKKNLTS
ncbi:hypothetical protein PNC95_07005 [Enterococcus faecium]|jgi:hypothetical protein|uniref:Uncharacterized protein n=2 Tax=Enterococcus TaxID=1350 RepID=A0A829A5B5_ENTFC|nr:MULTISPECIES: hypothetical protein [Enterococcus]ELB40371.1 hypothetical protein OKA_04048 [Enterococcus faecium EnGen0026]ELA69780.1 hypothetical protein OGO_02082 [Enterococcus faecium EnGen0015]ELB29900.1 hypothetical protein OK5_04337 [Enterococcus faecium EnGen0042]MCA6732781.1 hypothetical protein [Enterococcus lactis]MCA6735219.1 hypothetical protein [Enterococcus lactis]